LDKTGVVVGIVGQVQEIKGHREFVEAALRICELDRDVMFLVVGQPPDDQSAAFQEALKLSIRTAGHVSRFFFLGHRDDVAAVMRTLDVLVVPSYSESFGRVVVEAMAAGDAVVCSDAGALPELVTDGENGLLVRTGDVDGLLQTLLTMIRNRELRERLGRSARASAQKFAVEQHVDTLQHVYDDVLASCHGARR
jgi:glycosyltransferase involved in cell wall biosynthesis